MRKLSAADLFCGAGGTSSGAESSGAARVVCAVNHWDIAVQTHSRNFPDARHINSRLDQVNPSECPKIDLLFASPECTHHSRARGGKPTSDQQRAGAWDLMRWVEHHRPSWIVVENVREFRDWGPVSENGIPLASKRGAFFNAWTSAIAAAGYRVEDAILNAADFGAATSRERLFVVARKGNRRPLFPEPTHGKHAGGELPGMGVAPWRAAAEIIDWSIPCRSVFLRSKPLADKTLARIEAGLRRFVGPVVIPFLGERDGQSPRSHEVGCPLPAVTTANGKGLSVPFHFSNQACGAAKGVEDPTSTLTGTGGIHLAVPFQFQGIGLGAGRSRNIGDVVPTILATRENHGVAVPFLCGCGGRAGQSPPTDCHAPTGTLTTKADRCVAVPFISSFHGGSDGNQRNYDPSGQLPVIDTQNRYAVTVPFLADVNHGESWGNRTQPLDGPLGTLTTSRGKAVCVPFLVSYFGEGSGKTGRAIERPFPAITTKDRCGLVYAVVECAPLIEARSEGERKLIETMRELGVADIGFRMLSNPELSLAQGFRPDYWFAGTKADVTRQIGNSVSPPVAEAITRSLAG